MRIGFVLIVCLGFSSTLKADIRVLLRFDSAGHHVHRIIQVGEPQESTIKSKSLKAKSDQETNREMRRPATAIERGRSWRNAEVLATSTKKTSTGSGFAKLTWFDLAGKMIAQTEVADPRIVRSPSHTEAINASVNAVKEGAWLVSGPELAVRVTISLPESTVAELGAEFWTLELSR